MLLKKMSWSFQHDIYLQKCNHCQLAGATVGCNTRGCIANYHFMCAREDKCVLQVDKKVFCKDHKDHTDREVSFILSFYLKAVDHLLKALNYSLLCRLSLMRINYSKQFCLAHPASDF